ncbi:helix-turn-helix domain-containing protein [Streptomyces sp. NPDC093260]|uniref:helix-turn-helix domain-containing protein n=1 Tax=Streptomyces sp. NPDC093260 TaxID=3155073 RepID=UPI00342F6E55
MGRRDLPPGAVRLLRADGSVLVPPSIAAEVLRIILRDLGARLSVDGGKLSPTVHSVLWALDAAASAEDAKGSGLVRTPGGSVPGTPVAPAVSVEISTAEAARRMGCSESYLRRLARRGRVPARKVGAVWLIERAAGAADDETEAA